MSIEKKIAECLEEFHSLLNEVVALQEERKAISDSIEVLEGQSRQKFVEAVELMRKTGLGDYEISELVREFLRKRIPKSSLTKYLSELKPTPQEQEEEEIEQSTSQSGHSQNDDKNDTEQEETEIAVTTDGSQTTELEDQIKQDVPIKDSEQFYKEENEDPKDLEISFLKEKVSELEDALKKTQQFKPANVIELEEVPEDKTLIYEYLRNKADGIHTFFYDAYGIDLFKNRELAQLKNSGVKVFRRLYFEV